MPKEFDYEFKVGYKTHDKFGNKWKIVKGTNGRNKWIKYEGSQDIEFSPDIDYSHKLTPSITYAVLSKQDPTLKDRFSVMDLYDINRIVPPNEIEGYTRLNNDLKILRNKIVPELKKLGKYVYIVPSTIDRKGRHWSGFPNDYIDHFYEKDTNADWINNFIYFIFYLDKDLNIYTKRKLTGRFSNMKKQDLVKVYDIINLYLPGKIEWDKSNKNAIMIGGSYNDSDESLESESEKNDDPYVVGFYRLSKTDIKTHGRPDHLVSYDDFNSSPDISNMIKILEKFGSSVSYSMAKEPDHILTVTVNDVKNKEKVAEAIRKQSSISIKGHKFRIKKTSFIYAQKGIAKEVMKYDSNKFVKSQ